MAKLPRAITTPTSAHHMVSFARVICSSLPRERMSRIPLKTKMANATVPIMPSSAFVTRITISVMSLVPNGLLGWIILLSIGDGVVSAGRAFVSAGGALIATLCFTKIKLKMKPKDITNIAKEFLTT